MLEITKHPKMGYGINPKDFEALAKLIPGMKTAIGSGATFRWPTDKEVEELVKKGLVKVVPPKPGETGVAPREKKTLDD